MLLNISSQPVPEDLFEKLVYPEGGVLVLILSLLSIIVSVFGNIILGYAHKHFPDCNLNSKEKVGKCLNLINRTLLNYVSGHT